MTPTTEPGLADAVVKSVIDAAQAVYRESGRPFALKGDVPTASFRWKPWVARGLVLLLVAGLMFLSWRYGSGVMQRILPPELLPPEALPIDARIPPPRSPASGPVAAPPVAEGPGAALAPAPAAQPAVPTEGTEFALEVLTVPPRASASAGGETIITPGILSLGAFPQPVELRIEKLGYQPETIVIDRSGFTPAGGRLQRVLSLTLQTTAAGAASPSAAPPESPVPSPPPAAPTPQVTPPAPKPTATAQKPEAKKPSATKSVAAKKPAVKPAEPAAPAAPAAPAVSPLQAAQACLAKGDNACAVAALQGKARTARELELLVETHRAMGNQPKAWEAMRTYLERFPDEKRAESYRRTLGQ